MRDKTIVFCLLLLPEATGCEELMEFKELIELMELMKVMELIELLGSFGPLI